MLEHYPLFFIKVKVIIKVIIIITSLSIIIFLAKYYENTINNNSRISYKDKDNLENNLNDTDKNVKDIPDYNRNNSDKSDKDTLENKKKIIEEKNKKLLKNKSINDLHYFQSSRDYWEQRYKNKGNSGKGSYNNLAQFKATVLNNFVNKNNINTVIEWGSGDCNQLSLANYKNYVGYDVSQTAIEICKNKFLNDSTKTFIHMGDNYDKNKKGDLSMSLDVIFHLLEDDVFNSYMQNLFNSSNKYVCIYSSNINEGWGYHVKHRKFTDWIDKYMSNSWILKDIILNQFPYDPKEEGGTASPCDFYFYEKIK